MASPATRAASAVRRAAAQSAAVREAAPVGDAGTGLRRRRWRWALQPMLLLAAAAGPPAPVHWVPAFGASPSAYRFTPAFAAFAHAPPLQRIVGTVRVAVPLAVGGSAVRVRLSNEEGTADLVIGGASVALAAPGGEVAQGGAVPLTFHGETSIVVPAGAPVISDPAPIAVAASDRLIVDTYLPVPTPFDTHGGARMTVAAGDATRLTALVSPRTFTGRPIVSGVAVAAARPMPVVVAFGDSLTDGVKAGPDALHGYPERLAQRLGALAPPLRRSVVNAGIGGNRLLQTSFGQSALARLDRDVLRLQGVSHLILLEGINDIGMSRLAIADAGPPVEAADLIAGYRQIILRAHSRGIKVVGGTLMPFKGAFYYTAEGDAVRQAVNRWIRTSGEFDGVVDFDAAMRSSADPLSLRPEFDSGDHLHPKEAGIRAMGDAVTLALLR